MDIREIDRVCDLYEQRLQAGESLSVDGFVEPLLGELKRLEREYWPADATTQARCDFSTLVHGAAGAIASRPVERYQLLDEIDRGGMGAIVRGRDTHLGRDLAIKVLLDSHKDRPDIVQRFVEEAQIGGQLQHPGVPPVYEIGTLPDGRLFFSMKLIEGQSLRRLLAQRKTPEEDRAKYLGIFEQICQTLAYAHSRGVIHRDLKPSNIMVGAFGEVQVMDWGLAKVLRQKGSDEDADHQSNRQAVRTVRSSGDADSDATAATHAGSQMGTPAFMAPEQARGQIASIDERADVFGLGAILCEILTGLPPFTGGSDAAIHKAERAELDEAHARLDACGADAELIELAKCCLSADAAERPGNAGVVAKEMSQYLESVERRLRAAEAEAAGRKEAEAVLAFFQDKVLATARPESQGGGLGHDATIRAAVDAAEPLIEAAFKGRPQVEASIRFVMGESYLYLGEAVLAIRQFERSYELRRAALGADHAETLASANQLAVGLERDGKVKQAISLFQETLEARKRTLGARHRDTLQSMNDLALAHLAAAQYKQTVELMRQTLKLREEIFGADHVDTIESRNNLAAAYWHDGEIALVPPLLQQAYDAYKANKDFGPDHPDTLQCGSNLGLAFLKTGDADMGKAILEEVLAKQQEKLPPDHPNTLTTMSRIADALAMDGKVDDANALLEQTLKKRKAALGQDHADTIETMNNLAIAYFRNGQIERAVSQMEELQEVLDAQLAADHPTRLQCLNNLATAYLRSGRVEEALPRCAEVVQRSLATLTLDHPQTRLYVRCLADCYEKLQRPEDSLPDVEGLGQFWKRRLANGDSKMIDSDRDLMIQDLERLVRLYESAGRPDQATQWREELGRAKAVIEARD